MPLNDKSTVSETCCGQRMPTVLQNCTAVSHLGTDEYHTRSLDLCVWRTVHLEDKQAWSGGNAIKPPREIAEWFHVIDQ